MFGIYRFVLAMCVASTHIGPVQAAAGGYAVFGFYTLSGYLMTTVLQHTYLRQRLGILRFYANRALRIYPAYIVMVLVTWLLVVLLPVIRPPSMAMIYPPQSIFSLFTNFSLVGYIGLDGHTLPHINNQQLIPVGWSLSVEWIFYLLLPFLAYNRTITLAWFVISLCYSTTAEIRDYPYAMRYSSPLAASLCFSSGAMIHHFLRPSLPRVSWPLIMLLAFVAFKHAVTSGLYVDPMRFGLYYSLCANVLLICCLLPYSDPPQPLARIDRYFGNLSYPIFLSHYTAGMLMLTLFPSIDPQSAIHLKGSLIPLIGFAHLLWRYIEEPVNRLRDRLRG